MLSPLAFPLDRIIDAEGRPLFEGRASKDMQAIAPLEHAVCHYPGSRYKHEKPMNVSGLRQICSHWEDLIAGLRYLRALYPQTSPHIRYIDLWRICNMGQSLPAFLMYRRHEPIPNGQLPANAASIYKVAIGLIHAAEQMAFTSFFRGAKSIYEEMNHDQLYSFVEENHLFIGPTEVCAGPASLIAEVVNVLRDKPTALDPAQKEKLRIGNEEEFLQFSSCQMDSLALTYLYSIITESLYSRLCKAVLPDGQSEGFFFQADSQLALLAGTDPVIARAVLIGIIHFTVSGRLIEAATPMSVLFNSGTPSPQIAGSLGKHALAAGVADDISRYLQLEKIVSGLSQTLKERCLAALGLEDSLHLQVMARTFSPPDSKMRSLLRLVFGINVLPSLQVQSQGKIVMSLADDAPWS